MSELDLRFFARLKAAILECPWCGELADIRADAKGRDRVRGPRKIQAGTFDPLTARWWCERCNTGGVLGVVLYLIDRKKDRDPLMPQDWRATLATAARMRELARGRVGRESWAQRRGKANQVRGEGEK